MYYYIIKVLISSFLIVAISEISKRSSFIASLIASLPLVSVLAILWLYIETKDVQKVKLLSTGIFWLVIPSLAFFLILPFMLKLNINFYISIIVSLASTVGLYFLQIAILGYFGIKF